MSWAQAPPTPPIQGQATVSWKMVCQLWGNGGIHVFNFINSQIAHIPPDVVHIQFLHTKCVKTGGGMHFYGQPIPPWVLGAFPQLPGLFPQSLAKCSSGRGGEGTGRWDARSMRSRTCENNPQSDMQNDGRNLTSKKREFTE